MQLKTEFDDEWKYWIWSNVNNGCHKKGIFEILLRNGFHFDSIKRELGYDPAAPLTVHNSVSQKSSKIDFPEDAQSVFMQPASSERCSTIR